MFPSMSMYYLSYTPLWISIIFIDTLSIYNNDTHTITEKCSIVTILVTFLIALFVLMRSFSKKNQNGVQEFNLDSIQEEKTITSEYLLSYILPLFAFDFTVWYQVVLFLLFFLTLGFLCIRHNYFSVNIVLEIIGYRFYKCDLLNEDGKIVQKSIVSREKLISHKTEAIRIRSLNNEYSFDLTKWNGNSKFRM